MVEYQELIHLDEKDIKFPRINRLMNRLVRKCRLTHASDDCIGCLGFSRCHRNAGESISIDNMEKSPQQTIIEVLA